MTSNLKQKELLLVEILRTANKLNHPIDEIMKTFDITQSQYNILRILRGVYPDNITVQQYANQTNVMFPIDIYTRRSEYFN